MAAARKDSGSGNGCSNPEKNVLPVFRRRGVAPPIRRVGSDVVFYRMYFYVFHFVNILF